MPILEASPKIKAQTGLKRFGERRTVTNYMDAARANPGAKVLTLFDLKIPIVASADRASAQIRWFSLTQTEAIAEPGEYVFLGEEETGAPVLACNFQPDQIAHAASRLEELAPLVDLRSLAVQGVLGEPELLIASQARALLGWHAINRFCTRCGGPVQAADGGWRRHCAACGLDAYPRMDPAVIMLISRGERCLLGHEYRFPENFYSTLAGFVEPGDDVEHAVRREIKEEAGIDVGEVRYVASQPWPFPHSLMIGCWGKALSEELTLDTAEIADARWFSREEVLQMLQGCHKDGLMVPPPISIAHMLIQRFASGAFEK